MTGTSGSERGAHEATYDLVEPRSTQGRFECQVACSCGEFERLSTSKVSAAQARSNARTTFNRHARSARVVSAADSRADTVAAERSAADAAQEEAARLELEAAEQATLDESHRLAEAAARADTAHLAENVRLAEEARRAEEALFANEARLAEEARSARQRSRETAATAAPDIRTPSHDQLVPEAPPEPKTQVDEDASGAPDPQPRPTRPSLSATTTRRLRRGLVPALVVAAVVAVVAIIGWGGDASPDPDAAGTATTSSTPSTSPVTVPTTAPPTSAREFVDVLRTLDPVFADYSGATLMRAGRAICTFYGSGQDIVQIIASIGSRGGLTPQQSATIVRLSSPVFCPQFAKPMTEELDGLG